MALREVIASFGIEVKNTEKLDALTEKIEDGIKGLKVFGAAIVAGELVKGFIEFSEHLAEIGHEIEISALKMGISTDSFQQLAFAANQTGVSSEAFTMGMLKLNQTIGESISGSGEAGKAFSKFGINVKDSHGNVKDADQVLLEVSDKMKGMGSQAERTAAATKLFGRAGRELLPILAEGSEGIAKMREEAIELGGGFSKDAVEASKKFHESIGKLELAEKSLMGQIAQALLPVLSKLVDWMAKGVAIFVSMIKNTEFVHAAMIALGAAAVVLGVTLFSALAPVILPILGIIAAIAVAIIIVDDILTLFQGGDSVLGRFIDSMFGVGASAKFVTWVKDAFWQCVDAIKVAWQWASKFIDKIDKALGKVAELIGSTTASTSKSDPEEQRQKIREQAAKSGSTVRFPGETQLEAVAARDQIRGQQGLPPISGLPTSAPSALTGPAALTGTGGKGGANISQPTNVQINLNGSGNTSADAEEIAKHVDMAMDRRNRAAVDSVAQMGAAE